MKGSTYLLLALLLVLGAIVLFLLPSSEERDSSDTAPVLTLSIDSASVVKIDIQKGTRALSLENVGGKWMVVSGASYPADAAAVRQFVGGLCRLKIGSHISSNPERQAIFQVDSGGTRLVITERSGASTSLIIGKMGPSFSEIYLRQAASKDVYLAEGIETWTLNKDAKDWRDRTVLSLPSESVTALTYAVGGKRFEFRRDSTAWKTGDETVATDVMNPPLATLSNLRADSFIDTALRVQTNPLSVSVGGAQNVALSFFPTLPDSAVYYVQVSNSSQWFVVNKATARQVFTPVEKSLAAGIPGEKVAASSAGTAREAGEAAVSAPPKSVTVPTPAARAPLTRTTQPKTESTPATRLSPRERAATRTQPPKPSPRTAPAQEKPAPATGGTGAVEDEGELSVHTVAQGETMQSIARKYNVNVEQIMKWNLLKTIVVKPGQELYIFQKK